MRGPRATNTPLSPSDGDTQQYEVVDTRRVVLGEIVRWRGSHSCWRTTNGGIAWDRDHAAAPISVAIEEVAK